MKKAGTKLRILAAAKKREHMLPRLRTRISAVRSSSVLVDLPYNSKAPPRNGIVIAVDTLLARYLSIESTGSRIFCHIGSGTSNASLKVRLASDSSKLSISSAVATIASPVLSWRQPSPIHCSRDWIR